MSQIQWENGGAGLPGRWEELEALMKDAGQELSGAPVGGLGSSARGAARSFLTAWSGYAGESREIAAGFVTALQATATDFSGTDQGQAHDFSNLDGRLGPER
ncbi:hypothetical protein [Nocardioides campestrisoli]|uniref:hypothetical protein n=1 Tax=Nocardioides campestrisoli TaxID=2736757 RepID=UPI0015E66379|nr:hypothetical protein [Nocardioides campestrisoli]